MKISNNLKSNKNSNRKGKMMASRVQSINNSEIHNNNQLIWFKLAPHNYQTVTRNNRGKSKDKDLMNKS